MPLVGQVKLKRERGRVAMRVGKLLAHAVAQKKRFNVLREQRHAPLGLLFFAEYPHLAGIMAAKSRRDRERGGFSRAVAADKTGDASLRNAQAHAAQNVRAFARITEKHIGKFKRVGLFFGFFGDFGRGQSADGIPVVVGDKAAPLADAERAGESRAERAVQSHRGRHGVRDRRGGRDARGYRACVARVGDSAAVEYHDLCGKRQDVLKPVLGNYHGQTQLAVQPPDGGDEILRGYRVKARGRLVEQ